tara:strand:+ start:5392 stop:6129 length:738 start_codon:yes stop_codon:yes gene_type:complete
MPDGVDLVFRWGTTSNVPCRNVVNTAKAIHQVNDKSGFRKLMDEHNLCPPTYLRKEDCPDGVRLVVRPRVHSRGRHLYTTENEVQLYHAIDKCGYGWYASPLIDKVAEYRVFVVQGRAVAVAQKTPGNPEDVAWNVAKGGRFDNVNWDAWPLKAVKVSVEAFNLSELDFGGVDVMVDGDGEAYVIEINSAPSLTSPYRQACFAKAFDWIVENGKERIPVVKERGGYLKFIHPAVCNRAKLVKGEA